MNSRNYNGKWKGKKKKQNSSSLWLICVKWCRIEMTSLRPSRISYQLTCHCTGPVIFMRWCNGYSVQRPCINTYPVPFLVLRKKSIPYSIVVFFHWINREVITGFSRKIWEDRKTKGKLKNIEMNCGYKFVFPWRHPARKDTGSDVCIPNSFVTWKRYTAAHLLTKVYE